MNFVGKFTAHDEGGRAYTVYMLQGEHEGIGDDRRRTMLPDAKLEMRTDDGRHVNFLGPGEYEIVDGTRTIRITSTDPNAPQT
jgi:hypothetical protein